MTDIIPPLIDMTVTYLMPDGSRHPFSLGIGQGRPTLNRTASEIGHLADQRAALTAAEIARDMKETA